MCSFSFKNHFTEAQFHKNFCSSDRVLCCSSDRRGNFTLETALKIPSYVGTWVGAATGRCHRQVLHKTWQQRRNRHKQDTDTEQSAAADSL